ncbi:MAG: 13E12 repeat family protein, partial [Actinobacteria bacterium]|nr:13E12 repeat family protein [Actinomycetota bacterium]
MRLDQLSTDELEQLLSGDEQRVSLLRARQTHVIEELDRRQVATADGCKSMSEWVATRLDVSLESAKSLVRTMRRTAERPDLRESLAAGEISFDRVEVLSRIPEDVGLLQHLDIAGVLSEAAKRV